ncbi:MAG: ribonuclease R [Clostridia bacterium]|nr:ribonuclease R [Clostridia bacterium]MCI8273968.1 ribonuclease R [Clostridia bacterium]
MEERELKILDFMRSKEYVPMRAKEIAMVMRVPKKEYSDFLELLGNLELSFKIEKNRKNRYRIVDKTYYEGIYRKNQKGFGFVKIEEQDEEVYISKENSMQALNGDRVLIEIIEEQNRIKSAEGRIIKILKHEKDTIVGIFQNNKNFGFVVPDDKNFGTDIFISKSNFGKARNNHKVLVKITKYPEKGKKAEGKIIEVLGNVNEAGVDMLSLIKEYNLPARFPEQVVEEAKRCGNKVDKKDIPNRIDLRDQIIFTIDGEDAKDLDDAVKVTKLDNGNYKLDVHIADVSYYVKENSLLDQEALIRGTSIYMLGRVIPMLPRELSNGICSLNAGEDRFTLSCSMEIDNKGKVVSSEVYKGIINVAQRMTYTDVQKIIDGSDKNVLKRYEKYIEDFKLMEELALILKNKRLEQGYLNLDIPESKIELDIDGKVTDIHKYETSFANEIIEQFMLTANETIAEKFFWLDAPFIYRVHEEPDLEKVQELNKFLFNFGLKIKANKDNIYPKEFSKILDEIQGKEEEKVISNLVLRTLKVARYEAENKGHFGIASKYYCHFTSPIRRYPDLFIHRIISKYLENNYDVNQKFVDKYIPKAEDRAKQSSEREKIATKVEREAEDIKKAEYMESRIGNEYEGIVSSITSFGMFVELDNTVEGLIRFEDIGDEYFIYDEDRKRLIGERTNKTYKIGDKVKIKVKNASKLLRQVDFEIV